MDEARMYNTYNGAWRYHQSQKPMSHKQLACILRSLQAQRRIIGGTCSTRTRTTRWHYNFPRGDPRPIWPLLQSWHPRQQESVSFIEFPRTTLMILPMMQWMVRGRENDYMGSEPLESGCRQGWRFRHRRVCVYSSPFHLIAANPKDKTFHIQGRRAISSQNITLSSPHQGSSSNGHNWQFYRHNTIVNRQRILLLYRKDTPPFPNNNHG